jgi:glucose/arabinose dehydrogenase
MRRIRNLALFGLVALVVLGGIGYLVRSQAWRALGVNLDVGPGGRAELRVPDGYEASVFASGLAGPRFMAISPDGVLFVAERGADRVVALPDRDADGSADEVIEVGDGYDRAHDIEFEADGRLLVAGETILHRVTINDLIETTRETVIDGLPPNGAHASKTVEVLRNGDLLLAAGSSCDVCIESDARRAAISLVSPDGAEQRLYMTGVRNAVGLWVDDETGRAWATVMGRDRLGDDQPPETLYEVLDGADGGWPRCHAGTIVDPEFGEGSGPCAGVAHPAATFPAHTSPLALVEWQDYLVIALHGSWNRSSKIGYKVVWLPWDGQPAGDASDLATGFLPAGSDTALGRPAGLAVGADGTLYVSDDKAGFIYRIAPSGG